jgi:signal transduction histidine kinase
LRFDDSLKTVLASDADNGFGAQATWRQLVDLLGRGKVPADADTLERLRALRPKVAMPVRAASARALAFTRPPATLVALFAEDELAIAAPVLRTATLDAAEWLALLPLLNPAERSVLRHRRDLPDEVGRGLESFGPVDFVIGHDAPAARQEAPASLAPPVVEPAVTVPVDAPLVAAPLAETPFQPLAEVARHIPVVAEALRRAETPPAGPSGPDRFEIADLKARIDAFQVTKPEPGARAAAGPTEPESFRFETDAVGTIRWIDGGARAALVGLSLAHSAPQGLAQIDGGAAGAFRDRVRFADARLLVEGQSSAAGAWRLSAVPAFDTPTGRFTGYRGVGRRPRADEAAEPQARAASESLRQLVHELRTPTNAIAGFAELIETQLLGPVALAYRERAEAIRRQTSALLAAIEDLDTAARIEGHTLDLHASTVALEPMVGRILADLAPLARLRGAGIAFDPDGEHAVHADDRAAERLVGRLLAALLSVCAPGERLKLNVRDKGDATVTLEVDRPAALAAASDDKLLSIDADATIENGAVGEGVPLLGTSFALRLARNLAAELGGNLAIGPARLTLRLPVALDRDVGRAAI